MGQTTTPKKEARRSVIERTDDTPSARGASFPAGGARRPWARPCRQAVTGAGFSSTASRTGAGDPMGSCRSGPMVGPEFRMDKIAPGGHSGSVGQLRSGGTNLLREVKAGPRAEAPVDAADRGMSFGSDVAAEALRRLRIPYIALNPGASFRGLHDSLVNYLGNETPQMLLVLHEMHAPAIAHGFVKASDRPMAVALHSNVGLMNGVMGVFNAWCDRAAMLILGANGAVDAARRRPWIEWIHTTQDQGALVRDFTKWDDAPASPAAAVESLYRAWQIATTPPFGPTYVCLDVTWQEERLERAPPVPDAARFAPGPRPAPAPAAARDAVERLRRAHRPVLLFGRGSRARADWDARVALAERLGARVLTDLKLGAAFPTAHPLHPVGAGFVPSEAALALLREADVICAFDWVDLGGTVASAFGSVAPPATIVNCTLDAHMHRGWSADHQMLPAADLRLVADPDACVHAFLDALGPSEGAFDPASVPLPPAAPPLRRPPDGEALTLSAIAAAVSEAAAEAEAPISLVRVPLGWPAAAIHFDDPLDYTGFDGGGGVGSGPGMAVGAALALMEEGRLPVAIMGDGDYLMGVTALWTAVRYRVPLLVLVANNRSYLNDEMHQHKVAAARGRPVENRWIGQRIDDPAPDCAGLARAQGAEGAGPVAGFAALAEATRAGLARRRGRGRVRRRRPHRPRLRERGQRGADPGGGCPVTAPALRGSTLGLHALGLRAATELRCGRPLTRRGRRCRSAHGR